MTNLFKAGFQLSRKGPRNCRSLGFPEFPVESCGFGQMRVVLFRENHISGAGDSCKVGNSASLGMTKEKERFHRERLLDRGVFRRLGWATGP
jgi:hypothetical protein